MLYMAKLAAKPPKRLFLGLSLSKCLSLLLYTIEACPLLGNNKNF